MGAWKYQIYSTSHVEHLNMTFSHLQYIDIQGVSKKSLLLENSR